jgi:hypothetical protein
VHIQNLLLVRPGGKTYCKCKWDWELFVPCTSIDIWHLAFGFWHLAFGYWHLAFGFWHLAFGYWHLAFGIWHFGI